MALTDDDSLVVFASLDHISWTKEMDDIAEEFREDHADIEATRRELRLRGTASDLFRAKLGDLGWTVVERAGE